MVDNLEGISRVWVEEHPEARGRLENMKLVFLKAVDRAGFMKWHARPRGISHRCLHVLGGFDLPKLLRHFQKLILLVTDDKKVNRGELCCGYCKV